MKANLEVIDCYFKLKFLSLTSSPLCYLFILQQGMSDSKLLNSSIYSIYYIYSFGKYFYPKRLTTKLNCAELRLRILLFNYYSNHLVCKNSLIIQYFSSLFWTFLDCFEYHWILYNISPCLATKVAILGFIHPSGPQTFFYSDLCSFCCVGHCLQRYHYGTHAQTTGTSISGFPPQLKVSVQNLVW